MSDPFSFLEALNITLAALNTFGFPLALGRSFWFAIKGDDGKTS